MMATDEGSAQLDSELFEETIKAMRDIEASETMPLEVWHDPPSGPFDAIRDKARTAIREEFTRQHATRQNWTRIK